MNIPRNEYPRPQLVRRGWTNLNGEWEFEIDNGKSGIERKFFERSTLDGKITVPFCPESELSGIGSKDFIDCVWYRREFEIPEYAKGRQLILHFGAVDYHAIVYVNGALVGEHKGGYTGFSFDITKYLKDSGNFITLCAFDNVRSANQPAGKQSDKYYSYGCFYTRTTGIWQTVWLEAVNKIHIKNIRAVADIDTPSVNLTVKLSEYAPDTTVCAKALWNGKCVGEGSVRAFASCAVLDIRLSEKHLWKLGEGNLYDLELCVSRGGKVCDEVTSYFGLRSVALEGKKFTLNGEPVFGRWVLDQGFYPDGIYTAPTDEALKNDILYSMQLGFNGARLHEKIFEERFLYHADKLGYMVWGEHANWQLDISDAGQIRHFLPEWIESVERDFSHPSIIGWCPFNETWDREGREQDNSVLLNVYLVTKALDPTRPVIDTSGNFHVRTDIFDVHDYEQNPEKFRSYYEKISEGIVNDQINRNPHLKHRQTYDGVLPVFVSEYGGIRWTDKASDGWGYGEAPKTREEFIDRYRGLTDALLDNPEIMGFCYTQLYDVEQEINGLMTYERQFKFDPDIFKEINTRKAAIEK